MFAYNACNSPAIVRLLQSLQASLASIGAALAASSATAAELAAAAAEDGAAAESALAGRRDRLEQTRQQEAEFHTAAGERLERAQTQLAEDTAALDTLLQQRGDEVRLPGDRRGGTLGSGSVCV